jgi:hypothetical protein
MQDHETPGETYTYGAGTPSVPPTEPPSHNEEHAHSKGRVKTYVVAIVLLLAVVVLVNAMKEDSDDLDTSLESTQQSSVVVTIDDGEGKTTNVELNEFVEGFALDAFDNLDQASLIINSGQGKPTSGEGSEQIVASVVSSDTENMVYFAAKSFDKRQNEIFNGIYHYNTVTSRWQRIYKNISIAEESESPTYLRVIARAGKQLVLFQDHQGSTTDPCDSWWLLADNGPSKLLLLNLEDPYAGFSSFELPTELRSQAVAEQVRCELAR